MHMQCRGCALYGVFWYGLCILPDNRVINMRIKLNVAINDPLQTGNREYIVC